MESAGTRFALESGRYFGAMTNRFTTNGQSIRPRNVMLSFNEHGAPLCRSPLLSGYCFRSNRDVSPISEEHESPRYPFRAGGER